METPLDVFDAVLDDLAGWHREHSFLGMEGWPKERAEWLARFEEI